MPSLESLCLVSCRMALRARVLVSTVCNASFTILAVLTTKGDRPTGFCGKRGCFLCFEANSGLLKGMGSRSESARGLLSYLL